MTDIPWSTFPDYIKEIIYLDTDDLKNTEGSFTVPFVSAVVRSNTTCHLFIGVNVAWGWLNNGKESLGIWSYTNEPSIAAKACLYRYVFNISTGIGEWTEYEPTAYGSNGKLKRMLPYYFSNDIEFDIYGYGGNGIVYPTWYEFEEGVFNAGPLSTFIVDYNTSGGTCSFLISDTGFMNGDFVAYQDLMFSWAYFESFRPPSEDSLLQQEQNSLLEEGNETSKGIWESLKAVIEQIKNLPNYIANAIYDFFVTLGDRIGGFFEKLVEDIKGLFIPEEGFFDTYQQEFQTYFKERFGILYEIPELVIDLMTKILNFNPEEDEYVITFPEVVLPVLEDGVWRDEVLIESQDYSFNFINEAPYKILYDMYVAFIWLVYVLLLVNLIKNKANSVFKGG